MIHGGVDVVNRFVFASDHDLIAAELTRAEADVVLAGHCGLPFIRTVGSRVWFTRGVISMPANDAAGLASAKPLVFALRSIAAAERLAGFYCWGVKPAALMAGAHSSESAFWIFASSSGEVPVA